MKYDKLYPIRVNSVVLSSAMEYCEKNGVNLSEEVRKIIDRYDRLNRKKEK